MGPTGANRAALAWVRARAERERPRYGGLNLMHHLDGACPGFGACHLRLRAGVTARATFVDGDSSSGPAGVGLADAFAPVLAPLLERIAATGAALGRDGVDVRAFAGGPLRGDAGRRAGGFAPAMGRSLDYVEAQVHGGVSLAEDVEAIVLDPAFDGTPAGGHLLAAAAHHGLATAWHAGSVLDVAGVPAAEPEHATLRWQRFCAGGRARRFAERVAGPDGRLDAAAIGRAAAAMGADPDAWGGREALRQQLKDLWVIVVAHGHAA